VGPRKKQTSGWRSVPQSEGDTNLTGARATWQGRALDAETRAPLAEDERYFLHQAVSTPCLNTIAKAEGIFIEDTGQDTAPTLGHRMMLLQPVSIGNEASFAHSPIEPS
jgi:hypothetical protein